MAVVVRPSMGVQQRQLLVARQPLLASRRRPSTPRVVSYYSRVERLLALLGPHSLALCRYLAWSLTMRLSAWQVKTSH